MASSDALRKALCQSQPHHLPLSHLPSISKLATSASGPLPPSTHLTCVVHPCAEPLLRHQVLRSHAAACAAPAARLGHCHCRHCHHRGITTVGDPVAAGDAVATGDAAAAGNAATAGGVAAAGGAAARGRCRCHCRMMKMQKPEHLLLWLLPGILSKLLRHCRAAAL
eukprot:6203677-Pleurochrysis_carterae.AAC.1